MQIDDLLPDNNNLQIKVSLSGILNDSLAPNNNEGNGFNDDDPFFH